MLRPYSALLLAMLGTLTGCGVHATPQDGTGRVDVVAAEDFWGSIVAQLGGDRVHVVSLVTNPATDPHSYEPRPGDARAIARAGYVVANGAGYDAWMAKLAAANPVAGRRQLVVADLVHKREGENPHFWYSPAFVDRFAARVSADLQAIDEADQGYLRQRYATFRDEALGEYHGLITRISTRYRGTPVGATESIFGYLAPALGLELTTPTGYMKAVSEGSDPSAADKVAVDQQVAQHRIKLLLFNSQNTTPDVNAVVSRARAVGIPVTAISETLAPAGAKFQDWQTAQLRSILEALGG